MILIFKSRYDHYKFIYVLKQVFKCVKNSRIDYKQFKVKNYGNVTRPESAVDLLNHLFYRGQRFFFVDKTIFIS